MGRAHAQRHPVDQRCGTGSQPASLPCPGDPLFGSRCRVGSRRAAALRYTEHLPRTPRYRVHRFPAAAWPCHRLSLPRPCPDGWGCGRRCPPPGVETGGFTDKLGGPCLREPYPMPWPPLIIGRCISQPCLRGRRRAAGGGCRRDVGRAQERIGRACLGPSWQRSRQSVAGCGSSPSAATGAGESPLFEIGRFLLVRSRGHRAPLARG